MHEDSNFSSFDVIVVGGGPAGAAAGFTAARSGLTSCIIDKSVFPRDKLCGGLVTPRAEALIERIFSRQLDHELLFTSDRVAFYSDGKHLADQVGYCKLTFVMRYDFDAHLLSLAEQAGASLLLGDAVVSVDLARNIVRLSSGAENAYRVLNGSDGVNSVVAKSLFGTSFDKNTIGFGLEVEVPRRLLTSRDDTVEIDFGGANWGYGWVFPKRKTFTIGVGGIHRMNPNLRDSLAAYLARKGVDVEGLQVKGQFTPFGDFRERPGDNNVLLAGDAAGVVDPITGEGIAYALETGCAAATAAIYAIHRDLPSGALEAYSPSYRVITRPITQAVRWRTLIFPRSLRPLFAWAFADASTLQKGYLDILAGKIDYNALSGLFVLQTKKAVLKLMRTVAHGRSPDRRDPGP